MVTLLERTEKELKVAKEKILDEGVRKYLELELRNLSIEISKIYHKYRISGFNDLMEKLERGEVSESECFDDLTKIEYLELEREKVERLLEKEDKR